MDQEANLHALVYLLSLAIIKLMAKQFVEDNQIPQTSISFHRQRRRVTDDEN